MALDFLFSSSGRSRNPIFKKLIESRVDQSAKIGWNLLFVEPSMAKISFSSFALGLFTVIFIFTVISCEGNNNSRDCGGLGSDETGDTWTDPATCLTWQVAPSKTDLKWHDANAYCVDGWRLPTISELRSLIRGCEATETGGPCEISDTCVDNLSCEDNGCLCTDGGGPNNGCYCTAELDGECLDYWSSSAVTNIVYPHVWGVFYAAGLVKALDLDGDYGSYVRCVR